MAVGRDNYIENIEKGMIVAFKLSDKMMSGKIVDIKKDDSNEISYVVETPNNSVYFLKKENIAWVKTGSRFPRGIYNALKYGREKNGKN